MKSLAFVYLLSIVVISCTSSSMSETNAGDIPMQEDIPKDEDMSGNKTYSGDFVSSAHPTSGKATINSERTILSFTDFKTDNGPVLEVYLATNNTAESYISLGELKGIEGNYTYALPENIDFTKYNHVIIWCVEFSVNFGYAVLK
ncbi:DM13 domain-containing protein [Gaetbulibacter saemankumensis]|uniref:DM13 domain-containing protein n=1 Tax=Gaetbulibacter saemankumensis TaxID=311208 RepID=UPI0004211492|nr:DM13 domain-containing protein [Gaetbulibacter saemankumensis]